jgi:hypothetical protein
MAPGVAILVREIAQRIILSARDGICVWFAPNCSEDICLPQGNPHLKTSAIDVAQVLGGRENENHT